MFYKLIRSGKIASDAIVIDLKVIQYCPRGVILYKINYKHIFNELPRWSNKIDQKHFLGFSSFINIISLNK